MKRFSTLLMFLILGAGVGCNQEQPITNLEVGREKLLGAGMSIEAVQHLKQAEVEEAKTETEKVEPRALLLIAYSYALLTGDAQTHGIANEYKQERDKRIASLNQAEMRKLLNLLDERHRTQDATMQALVDAGTVAVPLLIESIGRNRYVKIRNNLVEILHQIGSKGLDQVITAVSDANTPPAVKVSLVRLIARINDPGVVPSLEAIRSSSDIGLKMEINVTLYQFGKTEYRSEIIGGLSESDIVARRAAAKALPIINDAPKDEMIKALRDSDAKVRMYSAQGLEKFPTQNAIKPLIEILKDNTEEENVKQAAVKALIAHGEHDFGKILARRLIQELPHASEPNDRIRMVQVLKSDAVQQQIKTAPKAHDDNIEYDLYLYYHEKEQNDMVKEELNVLLNALGN